MRAPRDPALPRLGLLLDPDAMAPLLERSLGRPARLGPTRIARIAYKPGVRAVVHYEVAVDGRAENAVAFAQPGRGLAGRARRPDFLRLARRVDGRSPAGNPVTYDADADALFTWLPLDSGLPALAEPPHRLAERLARAGVGVAGAAAEPTIVPESYKPGARIVLRLGRHVLKAYGDERSYERGVTGLRLDGFVPLRTPRLEACFRDLRLTVQSAAEGSAPAPEEAATPAGALVRRLQAARVVPPRVADPEALLALAAEKAALAARTVPELAPRLTRLLGRLQRAMPRASGLVPAHGDFDADQLLQADGGEPVVLDFDDVCLAAPALDLATYLADVVRGRDEDRERLATVREPLLAGYGACPPGLDWHVAVVVVARALHAFQRAEPDWPARAEGMVRTAGEMLAP
jgi:Phosphotransferase enzyme family